MVDVANLRLYEFKRDLPEWNEIGKSVVDGSMVKIEVCLRNDGGLLGNYMFEDFRYISISSQSDRLMEILETCRMEGPFGYNLCIYMNSPLINSKAQVPGARSYAGCSHYVIVDDDNWIDIISDCDPVFVDYVL